MNYTNVISQCLFVSTKTWHFLKALWFVMIMKPILSPFIQVRGYWVISGHRGRDYQDNSACLHAYVSDHTEQEIIWITKSPTNYQSLKDQGYRVLKKNSIAARLAILQASRLIYSHGEDDLDSHLIYWLKLPGIKVYLNHCLNLTKTGQMAQKSVAQMSTKQVHAFQKKITRFDYLLASSEIERDYFMRSFLAQETQYLLGGGAHLDPFFKLRGKAPSRTILYFPTFRDDSQGQSDLEAMMSQIMSHSVLKQWLQENGYRFVICHHINTQINSNPKEVQPYFELRPSSDIMNLMQECELFISDYSGLIADYLILDKAFVAFPYDLEHYLTMRSFYTEYKEIAYGPIVYQLEDLVEIITNKSAFHIDSFKDQRQAKMELYFPHHEAIYSEKCYQQIMSLSPQQLNP